jgi:hypothetical protein
MKWLWLLAAVILWPFAAVLAGLVVTAACIALPPYLAVKVWLG